MALLGLNGTLGEEEDGVGVGAAGEEAHALALLQCHAPSGQEHLLVWVDVCVAEDGTLQDANAATRGGGISRPTPLT